MRRRRAVAREDVPSAARRPEPLTEEGLPDRSCMRDALQQLGIHEEATALAYRFDAAIVAALRKRLGTETDAAVRAALTAAIRAQDDHATARP